jgi:hypothetical protein
MEINRDSSFGSVTTARSTRARARYLGLCALGIALAAGAGTPPMKFITFDAPGAGPGFLHGIFPEGTGCIFLTDCSVVINDWGVVTGYYVDSNYAFHGFLRTPDGKITTFDEPDADATGFLNGTFPNGIDDAGEITGTYADTSGQRHAFVRSPDGKSYTTIDPPSSRYTAGIALNLEGTVVGYYSPSVGTDQSYLRYPGGSYETWSGKGQCETAISPTIPCYGGGSFGINVFGTVSGVYQDTSGVSHGLVRSPDGKLTSYDAPGAGTGPGQGTGCPGCSRPINLWGAIAGYYIDAKFAGHGYLRSPDGKIVTFDVPGENPTYGIGCPSDCSVGLNDLGAITGYFLDANFRYRGYLRTPDGEVITFDAPGAGTQPTYGGCLLGFFCQGTYPVSINDAGVIAGYYVDANFTAHGFLLFPPEGRW